VGHIVDVHDSKAVEMELRRRDEQIRAILDHSPTLIFLKDLSGRYLLAGRQCQAVLGVPCEDIVGKTDYELLPVSMADSRRSTERKVLETGQSVEVEEVVFRGSEARTFLTSLFPLRDGQGGAYAFAGISTDITERKRAAEEAQQAVERRDRFLAMLSHELRTPLGAIVNATEILNGSEIAGPFASAAQVIGRHARHMGRLIDDLLDVGRITRDQIVMDARVVDLDLAFHHEEILAEPNTTSSASCSSALVLASEIFPRRRAAGCLPRPPARTRTPRSRRRRWFCTFGDGCAFAARTPPLSEVCRDLANGPWRHDVLYG
jgi:PAS domain S-box-containing protein